MKTRRFLGFSLVMLLCGCGGKIDIFNLATGAKSTLAYHYTRSGRGTITGPFETGETVQGEYSVADSAAIGWGSVYTSAGNATGTALASGGKRYGAAVLTGDKGTVLDCEFVVGSLTAHGTGACRDNHDGKYRMLF